MLLPRLIPVLTLIEDNVVKTRSFLNPKYVGDPLNAISIFSKLEADELMILDISTSHNKISTSTKVLSSIPRHASMPIGFGGGLATIDQVSKTIDLGFDKVLIRKKFMDFDFLETISGKYGNQALSVCLDIKFSTYSEKIFEVNSIGMTLSESIQLSENLVAAGVGELIVHDIDRDGTRAGFRSFPLLTSLITSLDIPIVSLGGCRSVEDAANQLKNNPGLHSVAGGACFVFQGSRDAILLNYPDHIDWETLIAL
jgi:cyclase